MTGTNNIVVTTVRLEQRTIQALDELASEENADRTTILKQAVAAGIREIKIKNALALYQQGRVSLGKASEIAGIGLWEFLDILKERKIGVKTDEADLERQLKTEMQTTDNSR